jgi:hypothetical protein
VRRLSFSIRRREHPARSRGLEASIRPKPHGPEGNPSCRERVFSVDWGIVFGATGMTIGLLSLVYSRTQAVHAQRQADAAQLATALELQRAMAERIYQARMDLVTNPDVAKEYADANPHLHDLYGDHGSLTGVAIVRNAIDGLQDIYFCESKGSSKIISGKTGHRHSYRLRVCR